jgi:glycosyltransferase involved in cell wall biosynthesis
MNPDDYIVLLNNDTMVKSKWLYWLKRTFEYSDDIGLVGGKQVYPDGTLVEAVAIIFNDGSAINYGVGEDPNAPRFNYFKEVDYASGACMMFKRSTWDLCGGFDERYYPAYTEDVDFCFKVRKIGLKVVYQPLSEIVHISGGSADGKKEFKVTEHQKIFAKKWDLSEYSPRVMDIFHGRDRSRGKKTILCIDYIPQYDKGAGDKTVMAFLDIFIEMNLNIKFLPLNGETPEPYTSQLEQNGIEIIEGKDFILENSSKFDYVLCCRPESLNWAKLLKDKTHAKILYYGHDLHYLRARKEYEIKKKTNLFHTFIKYYELETEIFELADEILYPSQEEIDLVKKGRVIQPYVYDDPPKREQLGDGLIFVGGFKHSPNVDGILWFINEIFPLVLKEIPEMKLTIIGSDIPLDITLASFKYSQNIVIPDHFVTDPELAEYYKNARICIVPLRYGAGVKGKVVEAMYYGVPIISTNIGWQGMPIVSGNDDPEHFAGSIINVYNNPDSLSFLTKSFQEYIVNNFSKQTLIDTFKEIL